MSCCSGNGIIAGPNPPTNNSTSCCEQTATPAAPSFPVGPGIPIPVPVDYVLNPAPPELPQAPLFPKDEDKICALPDENLYAEYPLGEKPCFRTSSPSGATELPVSWTKAANATSMVILGRVGTTLARLTGTGFIKVVNGIASLVENVALASKYLWPDAVRTSIIPVSPMAHPYTMVANSTGEAFLLKGKDSEDCVDVWNKTTKQWELRGTSEFPICYRGKMPKLGVVRLVGFAPIGFTDPNVPKCAASLYGEGLVIAQKRTVPPDDPFCDTDPEASKEGVVTVMALPPKDGNTYGMKWDSLTSAYAWIRIV